MGRIKTQLIKRTGRKLYTKHKERFSGDFNHNKGLVQELLVEPNKKLRNIVAGYVTRLVKQKKY
ncbi:MAG: 30S ribosomal protein S17e [Nanoarchaeota archaeon]